MVFFEPWLGAEDADRALAELMTSIRWQARKIVLFGKQIPQPRLTAWMGDPEAVYTYSGLRLEPLAWTPLADALRRRAEADAGAPFNSVLLNLYRDGSDSMGLHSDDEPELGPEPIIASASFGATRTFLLRPRRKRGTSQSERIFLAHNSLLVISGAVQAQYRHGVPKEPQVRAPRINLTFRRILPRPQ